MNVATCRLSEGELNLINMQVAQGQVPVGVDLATISFYSNFNSSFANNFIIGTDTELPASLYSCPKGKGVFSYCFGK